MGFWVPQRRAAERSGQGLDRRADDVEERLLGGQRYPGGLRVEAHPQRLRPASAEGLAHLAGPDPARGAVLRDLLEEADVGVEEEEERRGELTDVKAAGDGPPDVRKAALRREA